jgi:hypothetical protein
MFLSNAERFELIRAVQEYFMSLPDGMGKLKPGGVSCAEEILFHHLWVGPSLTFPDSDTLTDADAKVTLHAQHLLGTPEQFYPVALIQRDSTEEAERLRSEMRGFPQDAHLLAAIVSAAIYHNEL